MTDLERVWSALVEEAGEESIEEAARVSRGAAERELVAAGFDVAGERARAEAFLDALAAPQGVAIAREQSPPRERRRRRPFVLWLAAAASAAAVAGGVLYATTRGALSVPPEPTARPPSTSPAPSPDLVAAAELRRQARAACDDRRWSDCATLLDQARDKDLAGDSAPEVQALRDRSATGLRPKK